MPGEKDAMTSGFEFSLNRLEDDQQNLLAALEEFARARALPDALRYRLGLIVDEIVSNSLTHGRSRGEDCSVSVVVTDGEEDVVVEIVDTCPPFDPTAHAVERCTGEGEVHVGGVGLCLVRNLAARMDYARSQGCNRTRITICKNMQENACNSTK
jgi:anti-sigma regulatory factor (Ser/Thr protein kinase)